MADTRYSHLGKPPLAAGPHSGATIEEGLLFEEYFAYADWDRKTAKLTRGELTELWLQDVAEELWRDERG